ncbi:uncharacterized protein RJT21DRAFT_104039 [Scheffersomyces amazonensis]|uniref:uncharacterized protein n=1 Tax=Scheffersomyces amazonensis TaxID=1078765 RepID=UPI00315D9ED9
MKLTNIFKVGLLLVVVAGQIVDTDEELICSPSNPKDCYPKLFKPTSKWQQIREGQDIPAGLHVRLNIDTLHKEAKLMEPSEDDQVSQNDIVVVAEDPSKDSKADKLVKQKVSNIVHGHDGEGHGQTRGKLNYHELNDFDGAVYQIDIYSDGTSKDINKVSQALDTLSDLSHDIKFGVKLTADKNVFDNLAKLATNAKDPKITETIYRIMGSSLRNNPEAISNVLKNSDEGFINNLFTSLNFESDIIQKRILGIIQGLTQSDHFNSQYFSSSNNKGINNLISVFPSLGEESKQRFVNIFEDLNLIAISANNEKRQYDLSNPDHTVSDYLQNSLINNQLANDSQFELFFKKLVDIHKLNDSLRPSKEFLNWLSKEVEVRKENRKRDENYTTSKREFDESLIHARHVVFGNPHGLRKALADDL